MYRLEPDQLQFLVKFLCAYFKRHLWKPGRAREDYWMCYVMERAPPVNVARPQVTRSSEFTVVLCCEVEASEVEVPLFGTALKRKHQGQRFCRRFHKENRHGDEAQTAEHCEPPASGQEREDTELSLGVNICTDKEGPDQSEVLTRPIGTSFTSFLRFRLSSPHSRQLTAAESEPKPIEETLSLPVVLKTQPRDKQLNGRTSEQSFPAKREDQVGPSSVQPRPDGLQAGESTEDAPMNLARSHEVDIADPTAVMLSSTMASVLAPHWSVRPRRNKRGAATDESDDRGNAPNWATHIAAGGLPSHGPRARESASLLGTGRSTAGWSAMSGPPSVNAGCASRPPSQSKSLDVHPGLLDNRGKERCVFSTQPTPEPTVSPLSFTQHETQGISQAALQEKLSFSRSKPATSSLLFSLRKLQSNWRQSSLNPVLPVANPCTNGNTGAEMSTQNVLSTPPNNNEQEHWIALPCSTTRTIETTLMNSPPSPNNREGGVSNTDLFSSSCIKRDPDPLTLTESPVSSSRLSQYDRYAILKSQSLPRGTTLRSTSWWKQVSQDDNPLGCSDETHLNQNKTKTNASVFAPCNRNADSAFTSTNDNKRFGYQIPASEDNNTTAQVLNKGIASINFKTKGGASVLMQNKAQDTPGQSSGRFVKRQDDSILNNGVAQTSRSLPSFSFKTKISSATGRPMLTHPQGPSAAELSNNVTELPLALPKPKSQNIPSESISNQVHRRVYQMPSPAFHTRHLSESSSGSNSHSLSLKVHNPANSRPQLLGFERTYPPVHTAVHPKLVSTLISTAHKRLSSTPSGSPVSSPSPPPATAITTSFLLTPPATPTSPHSPNASRPGGGRTFSSSLDLTPKKGRLQSEARDTSPVVRRDSAEPLRSEATKIRALKPLQLQTSPASPSRPTPSVETPSIFSVLRAGSPSESTSPRCPPTTKTAGMQSWRGEKVDTVLSTRSSNQGYVEGGNAQQHIGDRATRHGPRARESGSLLGTGMEPPSINTDCASRPPSQSKSLDVHPGLLDDRGKERCVFSIVPTTEHTGSPLVTLDCRERALTSAGTLSVETRRGNSRSRSSDFVSGYNFRYSAPPYLTLKSAQSSEGQAKNTAAASPIFPETTSSAKSLTDLYLPLHSDPPASITAHGAAVTQSGVYSCQAPSKKTGLAEMLTFDSTVKDKSCRQDGQNSQDMISQPLQVHVNKVENFPSTCVVETIIYRISKANSTDKVDGATHLINHSSNTEVSMETRPHQRSNGHRSEEGSDECSSRKLKKSRFFPLPSKKEILPSESPNKVFPTTKSSDGTSNTQETAFLPGKSRPETGRTQKSTKMDQVFSRLKQAFGSRHCEDDIVICKQASSINRSSIKAETNKTIEGRKRMSGHTVRVRGIDVDKREEWTENRYALVTSSDKENNTADCQSPNWSGKISRDHGQRKRSTVETLQAGEKALAKEPLFERETVPGSTSLSPALHQLDVYRDGMADGKPTNQSLYREPSHASQQYGRFSYFATFPLKRRSTTASAHSPLFPYNPVVIDDADDSVFYSPKAWRQNEEFTSWGQPVEVGPTPKASAGPSMGGGHCRRDSGHVRTQSTCADLKYGIEARRSISVSSVLSSRPSGPGRISTGSQVRSASPSPTSAQATCRGLDQWMPSKSKCRCVGDGSAPFAPNDPGQARSRSLPRSLTSYSLGWGANVVVASPRQVTSGRYASAKTGLAPRSPSSLAGSHTPWDDAEGPPTPPPSPPRSPVSSRRMSKPPSPALSSSPRSPGSSQESPRGHLPSRGYMSSLSAFEESSDSNSDTTTDDEYYLEAGESEEMETEL